MELNKTVWILWLQGWHKSPWLVKQVAESWLINNPEWKIEFLSYQNLGNFVNDIDYIYDKNKKISAQALSDIIRLSLLKNHGGVWADATMLCMQPLDHWIYEAIHPSGVWMYHGHGANMKNGPASWFIISTKGSYIINKWKEECDNFWINRISTDNYFWMDGLFKILFEKDEKFKQNWLNVPYLYCEEEGQSHSLFPNNGMVRSSESLKNIFTSKPPYALKFWTRWENSFPDINTQECKISNGYHAIQMSKRRFSYYHEMKNTEQ